jgi:hypothetical protein
MECTSSWNTVGTSSFGVNQFQLSGKVLLCIDRPGPIFGILIKHRRAAGVVCAGAGVGVNFKQLGYTDATPSLLSPLLCKSS